MHSSSCSKTKQQKASVELPAVKVKELATISGEWNLDFQKNRGAPASVKVK
jgi:hypothetical protein